MYFYRMIGKGEENQSEGRLAESAVRAATICLQLDVEPVVHFITESRSQGYIQWPQRIHGYCNLYGTEIFINHGLTPRILVTTAIHECRHCFQRHDPKWSTLGTDFKERDARFYASHEFWGNESNGGDEATLTRTLERIFNDEDERLWKKAQASVRAQLSKPTNTQESDQLRRQFAPVIKARSLAVQRLIDPSGRRLFPANIEFSSPCATLKLSYQK